MKRFNYILILFGLLLFSSCEDYFGDINVDPDVPSIVTPSVLLPTAQGRLAIVVGGDASRFTGLMTQHINGLNRQFFTFNNYLINGSDTDNMWANIYSGVLNDLKNVRESSEADGYNHFVGIAKALEAYTWMMATDLFGDIPFSEALQGPDVQLQPSFDSQQDVYTGIFTLLEDARRLLALDDGGFAVGSSDLVYGGDTEKWIKFCNILEARGYLHLSKRDASNYQNALNALANGFTSRADDARFQFSTASSGAAPWFQYIQQRDDCEVGESYVALMESLDDPRIATYGFEHSGEHPILKADRAMPILTYTEAKFIEAECLENTGGDASGALLDGVTSSFTDAEVTADASAYVGGLGAIDMEVIATQKYIAMFNDPEAFNDWRRTGIPTLTPNSGNEVPRKFPYAQTEVLSNNNTPSLGVNEIFTRVWWDE